MAETTKNFARAYRALRNGDPVARKIAKAAMPFDEREARLEEREARSAFTDAYAAMYRDRKVQKVVAAETTDDRERYLVAKAIEDLHAGKKLIARKISEINDADRTVQKAAPSWRFF
jgi:hypothetical protein